MKHRTSRGPMNIYQTCNILFALLTHWAFAIASGAHSAEPSNKSESSNVTTISEKELNRFVKAYVPYQGIRAKYNPALERAKEDQERKRIEQETEGIKRVDNRLAINAS